MPKQLVFIDETWTKTKMTRFYGRAPRHQRVAEAVPHGHWKTSTFIGALRCDGISAAGVVDGAINGELFLAWVEQVLVPTLRRGDVVIMDNLGSHKPYSPNLNPIEMAFAKLKACCVPRSFEPSRLYGRLSEVSRIASP